MAVLFYRTNTLFQRLKTLYIPEKRSGSLLINILELYGVVLP